MIFTKRGFYWCRIDLKIKNILRDIKYAWQRANRGYADCDIYSLDAWLTDVIPRALRDFNKLDNSHPPTIPMDEWHTIIEKIAKHLEDSRYDILPQRYESDKFAYFEYLEQNKNIALDLLKEHWYDLWD